MHDVADAHGIDRAERIAPMIFRQFIHPGAEPFSGLGRIGGGRPNWTTNSAIPMSFCTGTGNSLKSFFEEPSQYRSLRFSDMEHTRSDIERNH